jgi:hypothetical protein
MDIIGPIPAAQGNLKYDVVTVEFFLNGSKLNVRYDSKILLAKHYLPL